MTQTDESTDLFFLRHQQKGKKTITQHRLVYFNEIKETKKRRRTRKSMSIVLLNIVWFFSMDL